jgi:DNA processing protein
MSDNGADKSQPTSLSSKTRDVCKRAGITILDRDDRGFPENMLAHPTCPRTIFVKGSLPRRKSVTCVGTREPTAFGVIAAKGIVGALAKGGWSIVSGLAIGIDTACHKAALEVGGHTVAVLAHGLDLSVYPRDNAKLAKQILESGGTLLSEYPPGIRTTGRNLVQRDRLQAALGLATFCIQTGLRGGSLHATRETLALKRPLYVPQVPAAYRLEEKNAGIMLMSKSGSAKEIAGRHEYKQLLEELELLLPDDSD